MLRLRLETMSTIDKLQQSENQLAMSRLENEKMIDHYELQILKLENYIGEQRYGSVAESTGESSSLKELLSQK